jgi:hypothetical protein
MNRTFSACVFGFHESWGGYPRLKDELRLWRYFNPSAGTSNQEFDRVDD